MEVPNTIRIEEYLKNKGIGFKRVGTELTAKCIFNDCDSDSTKNESHLYFNSETGQYECKKCGEKGNIFTLAKHFGDPVELILSDSKKPIRNRIDINLVKQIGDNKIKRFLRHYKLLQNRK